MSAAAKAIIAYLMGSFWLCVACVEREYDESQLEAAYAGETLPFYEYRCDHPGCGNLIQAKLTTEGDGLS